MVPLRGRGTSFEPSVMDPGEVDLSLAARVEAGGSVAVVGVAVNSIESCLGGNGGGGGRGASVESMRAMGRSATPICPSGRTE